MRPLTTPCMRPWLLSPWFTSKPAGNSQLGPPRALTISMALVCLQLALPAQLCGDCDGSGVVTVVDALIVAQSAAGLPPGYINPTACDVDGSGSLMVIDALLIAQAAAGIITLVCERPPIVMLQAPVPPLFGDVPLEFTLSDRQGGAADVRFEVSFDGGTSWRAGAPAPGTLLLGLAAPAGTPASYSFSWRTLLDVGIATADDLHLRLIATDGVTGLDGPPSVVGPMDVSNLDIGRWQPLATTGVTPSARYGSVTIPVDGGGMHVLFGRAAISTPADPHRLDLVGAPHWSDPSTTPDPATGRAFACGAFDDIGGISMVFGGETQAGQLLDEVILLSSSTGTWSAAPVGAGPSPRSGSTAVFDRPATRMLVIGGDDGLGSLDEVWALDMTSSVAGPWWQLATAGAPARAFAGSTFDVAGDRVLTFGGREAGIYRNTVHELDPRTGTWNLIATAGIPPAPRGGAGVLHDPATQRLLVFGGSDAFRAYADVWALDFAASPPRWRPQGLTAPGTPGRRTHASVHLDGSGDVIVFGGVDPASTIHGDTWRFER